MHASHVRLQMETESMSTVCHSPCCKCIVSSETCCSCVAVDNGSLPCFSNQLRLFNPPTHCLSISLSVFLYLHLTLIAQPFVHRMSIRDVRFGPAPAEAQTEPQRGHRERHQRRSYWMSELR